jgi:glycine cleavage system H protein
MTAPPEPSPAEYAVSPAIGPVPGIYVHLPRERSKTPRHYVPIGGIMSGTPADLRYSSDHLWVRPGADGLVRVGVTDFAQQSLGDVVDVSPPRPGDTVTAGEACGDIESVKSVSDLIAPVSGTVRDRNGALAKAPELVNSDPYGQGWLFEIQSDPASLGQQLAALLDADAYHGMVGA